MFVPGAACIFTVSAEPPGTKFKDPQSCVWRRERQVGAEVDLPYTIPESHLRSVVCDGVRKGSPDALSKGSK